MTEMTDHGAKFGRKKEEAIVVCERGEACTPEEQAALERFSAEFERA